MVIVPPLPKVFIIKYGVIFHSCTKGSTRSGLFLRIMTKVKIWRSPSTPFLTHIRVDAKQNSGWWAISHLISQAVSVVWQSAPVSGVQSFEGVGLTDRDGVSVSRLCKSALTLRKNLGQTVGTRSRLGLCNTFPSCHHRSTLRCCISSHHLRNHLQNVGTHFLLNVLVFIYF